MEIKNSIDFVNFIGETMEEVKKGDITPAAGNAVANLSGKLIQMIVLEMSVVRFPKLGERGSLQIEAPVVEPTKRKEV